MTGIRRLLLAVLVLIASPAQSAVICGKEWVTFTGTIISKHIPDAVKQRMTVRKAEVDSMTIFQSDQGLRPTGLLYLEEQEAPYEIDAVEYFEVVRCLD